MPHAEKARNPKYSEKTCGAAMELVAYLSLPKYCGC